ncbi:MAG: hypothetical protein KBD62_36005 [Kofleriaceae bacterium]|nr:hypothetical protein [Kofleriaceae bacterium]
MNGNVDDDPALVQPAPKLLFTDSEREIVAHWPCWADGCKNTVPVTAAAKDAFDTFCKREESQGRVPLKQSACVFCDSCGVWYRQKRAEHAAKIFWKVREMVAVLKDPNAPTRAIQEAEAYVVKHGNDGADLVKICARVRLNGGQPLGTTGTKKATKSW